MWANIPNTSYLCSPRKTRPPGETTLRKTGGSFGAKKNRTERVKQMYSNLLGTNVSTEGYVNTYWSYCWFFSKEEKQSVFKYLMWERNRVTKQIFRHSPNILFSELATWSDWKKHFLFTLIRGFRCDMKKTNSLQEQKVVRHSYVSSSEKIS